MIYADYNGSSPLLTPVREYLKKRLNTDLYANPNAIHSISQKLSRGIEKCREVIAEAVGCYPDQIFFNSGSSEGISHIFHSILDQADAGKKIIITSPIEHSVIPNALAYYEAKKGFTLKQVEIDKDGFVQIASLEKLLNENKGKVAMVTIMAANNETGVIQPYVEMANLCRTHGVEFFSDTTQLIGKGEFNFEKSGLDYAVCSGHKLGALSGSGFVVVKEPPKLSPLVFGSTQERGLRGGTQHYLGIETLAIAMKDFSDNAQKLKALEVEKLKFEADIKKAFPEAVIVGEGAKRLAGTTLIGYPGIHGQAVQIELESHDIFVTTSAACTDNQPETSKVLKAMGVNDQIGRGVIRISLSYSHGEKEYSAMASALKAAYTKLRKIQSF
ncbi:cysteine desulfurase family protein [Peredibacter starrii]|uniref:cysteine desulfurase n=1 Tax=Peredibacter starrii TaxID=28202 RepID=A0AAX4HPD1_9BACT|nr:aminotransferase class V-fold PLP-dependent enzyme [Peredibacter starrii]WPU65018.1 aminotransferase class V-fold PLP-dependent enzyme [Peredibacter starrii]